MNHNGLENIPNGEYWYLATPYTRYHAGIHMAFVDSARVAGDLIAVGVPIFSPIAHTHPIACYADLDPKDHNIWLPADAALMNKAYGLLIVVLDGWDESKGVKHEIEAFQAAGKPIFLIDPDNLKTQPYVN